MLALDFAWNALLLAADAAILHRVRAKRTARSAFEGALAGGFAAMLAGGLVGGEFFSVLRLWAWAIFLHGPLLLGAFAVLLRGPARGTAAALSLLAAVVAVDAFFVEPTNLELTRIRLESPKVEKPLRIGVLADLQTDVIGAHEERAVRMLMEEKPDLLLLPGDFLQAAGVEQVRLRGEWRDLLRRAGFSAPLGAFAVRGDVDPAGWPAAFEGLPVTCVERTRTIELPRLRLSALDFETSCGPARVEPSERFHVAFGHRPDFALGEVQADLLVAGHTHGGQVRLPVLGPLVTLSRIPRAWAAGSTRLEGGRTLLVSRGVGMERGGAPRLRLLCRPEVVLIEVVPPSP